MPILTLGHLDTSPVTRAAPMRLVSRSVAPVAAGEAGWSSPEDHPRLRPVRLHWAGGGDVSTLSMACQLGMGPGGAGQRRAEDPASWPTTGDEVRLLDDSGDEWFVGHVAQESILIQANPDVEARSILAYGPELRLRGVAVHGRWCKKPNVDADEITGDLAGSAAVRDNVFCADLPTIFNAAGRPNASSSSVGWSLTAGGITDPDGRVFEPEGRIVKADGGARNAIEAEYWTAYTALRSLLEWADDSRVISARTDWAAVKALLGEVVLPEVVVEGALLTEAIARILTPVGFGFCLEPWSDGVEYDDGGARHILHVYNRRGSGDPGRPPILADTLDGEVRSDSPVGQGADVQRLEFLRDNHNVTNDVTVVGDVRRVQVCLNFTGDSGAQDLHPAWDTDAHDLADWAVNGVTPEMDHIDGGDGGPDGETFIRRYSRGGEENLTYFNVFRTFVWNEDGAYRPHVDSEPDLAAILPGGVYTRRPRPLGPTCMPSSPSTGAGVLPAYVEVGVAGDDSSWILLPQAAVLADRAGFTINVPRLDRFYPYANAAPPLRKRYFLGVGRYSLATLLYNALRSNKDPGDYAARFRLVGSITADTAVVGRAAYRVDSSWPLRAARVEYRPDRFRNVTIAPEGNPAAAPALTADDEAEATAHALRLRDASADAMAHGSIVLRSLARDVRPGLSWRATAGRPVSLEASDGMRRTAACVVAVTWNFAEGGGKTEVLLDSPLLGINL